MSKAKTTTKVLRTALNRVQKGWKQGSWIPHALEAKAKKDGKDGTGYGYCIVGAVSGQHGMSNYTPAQNEAMALIVESMEELAETRPDIAKALRRQASNPFKSEPAEIIPSVNDAEGFTFEDAEKVIKKALIKAETAELMALEGVDDEEIDDLLENLNSVD